jgi:peptide/nickel transport system substrate-binding protein
MDDHDKLSSLTGPEDSTRILRALERGASRRDVLAMLVAGGMRATLAGGIAGAAVSAHAQTPRKGGRLRVAGARGCRQ